LEIGDFGDLNLNGSASMARIKIYDFEKVLNIM